VSLLSELFDITPPTVLQCITRPARTRFDRELPCAEDTRAILVEYGAPIVGRNRFRRGEEVERAVREAMNGLTDLQRRAVSLCYFSELSQTEAAKKMGISQQAVSKHLRLAYAKMQKHPAFDQLNEAVL
jgi:RNA polymerase sigma factor (sigma-70 family)